MGSFEKLKEAKELFDQGILSEEEYQKLKERLLNELDHEEDKKESTAPGTITVNTASNVGVANNAYSGEGATTGMKALSFLIPLIGFILFIVDKDKKPVAAHDELVWAGIGFAVGFVIYFISAGLAASAFY